MQFKWIKNIAYMSPDFTIIEFYDEFNEKIEPNTLPENLTTLIFGIIFNQKIKPNTLPEKLSNLLDIILIKK